MTTRPFFAFAAALLLCAAVSTAGDTDPEPTGYKEVELATLKAAPEDYNHDKVVYDARFMRYLTTFPEYIDKSGFDSDRDFLLFIGSEMLPVMARKNDDLIKTIAELKPGQTVRVYGKVDKFRATPERNMLPRYYVKLTEIRVVNTPPVGDDNPDAAADADDGKVRRPWRDARKAKRRNADND